MTKIKNPFEIQVVKQQNRKIPNNRDGYFAWLYIKANRSNMEENQKEACKQFPPLQSNRTHKSSKSKLPTLYPFNSIVSYNLHNQIREKFKVLTTL